MLRVYLNPLIIRAEDSSDICLDNLDMLTEQGQVILSRICVSVTHSILIGGWRLKT